MKQSKLRDGTKMHVVPIRHFVTLTAFSSKLADKFYNDGTEFPENLSKKEAKQILSKGLFLHGINSEYGDGCFEASYEEGTRYNSIFDKAHEWVLKNYPYYQK